MRITLSYTMMTGRIERQLDSEAELVVALQELGGAGASDISVNLIDAPSAETAAATDQTPPPVRQIDPSSQSISLVDARRPDRPIIYVNRGFEFLTGYSRDECMGRNCRFLQGPDTDRSTVDRIRHASHHGEELIVDLLNYRKNGTTFWNRLSLQPVRNATGELTHIIGIQSDITHMLALQETMVEWAMDLGRGSGKGDA